MPKKHKRDDPIAQEMARRIVAARKARDWTQAQLAAQTGWRIEDAEAGEARGLSPSRIGNYEQGTRRLGNEEAEVIGEAFGLPAAYFMVVASEREAEVLIAMRKGREPSPDLDLRRQRS